MKRLAQGRESFDIGPARDVVAYCCVRTNLTGVVVGRLSNDVVASYAAE